MNKNGLDSRNRLGDLTAFATVAEEKSFTRAAARLGLSQSALSHSINALEARLGVRLLARTTRSVATTDAGEQLIARLHPALREIDSALAGIVERRDIPTGSVRITTFKLAAMTVLWPMLPAFSRAYPGIQVEVEVSDGLVDIVADRFDAGIRMGHAVEKDMIGVPVGSAFRIITVASPDYLARHGRPTTPRDLLNHRCLRYRLTTSGQLSGWHMSNNGRSVQLKVEGPLISNDNDTLVQAALSGLGLARVLDGLVREHLDSGRLVHVLPTWSSLLPPLMLYHPSRRLVPPALAALIAALRAPAKLSGSTASPK